MLIRQHGAGELVRLERFMVTLSTDPKFDN